MPGDYGFSPLVPGDVTLIRTWLGTPHVRKWWGEPDEQLRLIEAEFGAGVVDMRLVTLDGHAFAFVQDYPAHHWPLPQFVRFPDGSRAIDTFIGEVAMLGKGHAHRFLHQRAQELRAGGCPTVVIDPEPANTRAIAAYRKAGFIGEQTEAGEDGNQVIAMEFKGLPT